MVPADNTGGVFELLHPRMQRWVHAQGWQDLREAQRLTAGPVMAGRDVVVAAPTAAGKTEAVFLPMMSVLLSDTDQTSDTEPDTGLDVLCVSPLKALINDQHQRLEDLCGAAGVAVHRWHGDVPAAAKRGLLKHPSGVLLITPESLEALMVTRGPQLPALVAGLRFVVIDELHSFIGTPRGAQTMSLLRRVEFAVGRRVCRLGLSATLGDTALASRFLRPQNPDAVTVVVTSEDGSRLRMQMRGYVNSDPDHAQRGEGPGGDAGVVAHLFEQLRGEDNLVFANSRSLVEAYADALARRSEKLRVPCEFWPHHGSLSKERREHAEDQLRDTALPATAVCTSTLEMGIDIGSVASIAQIGPPSTVAGLRQRLGRSGRRGAPAALRVYTVESALDAQSEPLQRLRVETVQAAAMLRLLLTGWLETPSDPGFNYSTLIQQLLSLIAQHGGATPAALYEAIRGPGPFSHIDTGRFVALLKAMKTSELIEQAPDGYLLHGDEGEQSVNRHTFYASFRTPQEWRLIAGGEDLGTIPIEHPINEAMLMIFAGRRWRVTAADQSTHTVHLAPASAGAVPRFGGTAALVSDRVRQEMRTVYTSNEMPAWLDNGAKQLISEAREAFTALGLSDGPVASAGNEIWVFPWRGDKALCSAALALSGAGVEASVDGPALRIADRSDARTACRQLLAGPPPDPLILAASIENTETDKWDWALSDELARESAAVRMIDVEGAWQILTAAKDSLR